MGKINQITVDRAREVLDYSPETGEFKWRVTLSNRALAGSVAGTVGLNGYRYISVDGARCLAHRLAWLYMTGSWPTQWLDHIDTDSANNRWANLRQASATLNAENKRRPLPGNKVGILGVSPGRKGRFKAQIQVNKRNRWIGEFSTPEEAAFAYAAAKRQLHGGCTL